MEEVKESGLVVLFKENKINETTALELSSSFDEFYNRAKEWQTKATEFLNNPNLSDEEKVKEARTARLALVKVRTGIEAKRKELNESDQQKITDRNSAAKVLTALVTPTETLLLEKEKEAEIADNKRKQELKESREASLKNYNVDCQFFDLANMPGEAFKILLDNSAIAFRAKAEEEKKAAEQKEIDERVEKRKIELSSLGFIYTDDLVFKLELGVDESYKDCFEMPLEDLMTWPQGAFNVFVSDAKKATEAFNKVQAEKKAAEENRLKAEKEELERKNLLLQQQEKERQQKHETTIHRQSELAKVGCVMEYDVVSGITDDGYNELWSIRNKAFQEEQNRLFIEKKKKERDEAIKLELAKRQVARIKELADHGVRWSEERGAFVNDDLKVIILQSSIDVYEPDEWVNGPMAGIASAIYYKRQAEIAPEKQKIKTWLDSTKKPFVIEDSFSDESKKTAHEIITKMNGFYKWANEQIDLLK